MECASSPGVRRFITALVLFLPLVGAEAHWRDLFCGARVSEKDRPEIRKIQFQGHEIPVPIGISEEEFRIRLGDWLQQFPTADLFAVIGSRTHFTYGYLPVLEEKNEGLSDIDVFVHYPWQERGVGPVTLVRTASREFKIRCSFITRNAPNLSEFVRGREFQFPKSMQDDKDLHRRAENSWWRHWMKDVRNRFLDLYFEENPFVSRAERLQKAEGRISVRSPLSLIAVHKEAIILLPKGPLSNDAEAVLRAAGFIYVFQIERTP